MTPVYSINPRARPSSALREVKRRRVANAIGRRKCHRKHRAHHDDEQDRLFESQTTTAQRQPADARQRLQAQTTERACLAPT